MNQGVVSRIFEKDWGQGPTYSFTVNGDRTFYRLGRKKPSFAEGDSVRFETKQNGNSTYANDVVPWKEDGTSTSAPVRSVAAKSSSPGTGVDREAYWTNREARDGDVQKRIELQSCRNSAIELVRLLLGSGVEAVKLPAAQAKKEEVVAGMVEKYTLLFLEENKAGKPGGDEVVNAASEDASDELVRTAGGDDWN